MQTGLSGGTHAYFLTRESIHDVIGSTRHWSVGWSRLVV